MKRFLPALAILVVVVVAGVLVLLFIEGRRERTRERERERPVTAPSRVTRSELGAIVVTLDREAQETIALETDTLGAVSTPRTVTAYGSVADPGPLASLDAELAAAEAALAASRREAERQRSLHETGGFTSQQAFEAAEATFRSDEAHMRSVRQRIELDWGPLVSTMSSTERQRLVQRLLTLEAALVLVDLPAGINMHRVPTSARVVAVGREAESFESSAIGPELATEPGSQGQGFWIRIDGVHSALRPGAAVTAYLTAPGGSQSGVVVPRSSVVRAAGRAWVYLQSDGDRFERREVSLAEPLESGWFIASGVVPGDRIVVTGAQTLFSEEQKAQIEVGEEGERH